MTAAQYNEYQRQADVIEEEKKRLAELSKETTPDSFTFYLDREKPPIIVIDKEGFKYKGELVEDKGEIYKLFKNYLTSSLTEISDEEILKQGNYFFPKIEDVFRKDTWEMGAKWYREQLK